MDSLPTELSGNYYQYSHSSQDYFLSIYSLTTLISLRSLPFYISSSCTEYWILLLEKIILYKNMLLTFQIPSCQKLTNLMDPCHLLSYLISQLYFLYLTSLSFLKYFLCVAFRTPLALVFLLHLSVFMVVSFFFLTCKYWQAPGPVCVHIPRRYTLSWLKYCL